MKNNTYLIITFFMCIYFSATGQQKSIISASADASVYSGAKSNTYGSENKLMVKRSKTGIIRNGFVKFDISSMNALTGASKAIFKLYCKELDDKVAGLTLDIFETRTDWDENAVSWENAPKPGKKIGQFAVDKVNSYLEADLSDYLKTALAQGLKEISFRISDGKSIAIGAVFNTKESKNNPPVLEIQ